MNFSALIPDETVNYITNPQVRYDTAGFIASGATLTRVLSAARFGIASLQVVTAGSALREGAAFRVSSLSGVKENITVSAYVRGNGTVRIRLDNNVVGGTEFASVATPLDPNRWQRLSVSGFSTGGNDLRLYVETDEGAAKARTFYVDGLQMERKAYPTTYVDGDQPGCRWNGLYHGSTSQRPASTREGGKWLQLAGPEREEEDLYMTVVGGLGVAPVTNTLQTFALEPGAFFSNQKVQVRTIVTTFHAKHKVDDQEQPVSLSHLHALRQTLIDVVKPDRTGGSQAIWFEYDDGTRPVYFQARYDGGLEGEWDIRNQFVNSFQLRLVAESPFVLEDSQEAQVMDFQETLTVGRCAARLGGLWNNLNYGFNDDVTRLALGPRGQVYAIGDNGLTTANNNAAAVDPLRAVRAISYWDGEKWNLIGTTVALGGTGVLYDIIVAADGSLYVCGDFTSIGGVAANYIAKWNGSAWSALGTGLNAAGTALALAPDGDVYVGGTFTTAGGGSAVRIARWDGSSWHRLGQYGGLNGTVFGIAVSRDGLTLYCGGSFTDQNGNPGSSLTRVAQYNTVTGLFSAMASGVDDTVQRVKIAANNIVYICGSFLNSGSESIQGIAYWNGSTWNPLGDGLIFQTQPADLVVVYDMDFFSNGDLLAVGQFNMAGGSPANQLAIWNGSTWVNLDMSGPFNITTEGVLACLINRETDDFYIGWQQTASVRLTVSGLTTLQNPGSAASYPVMYLSGSGTLKWVENLTSQKRMYLNLAVASGEEVFIDFALGKIYSTVRGDLLYTLLPGSDFRTFAILPGENKIVSLMIDDVGAGMSVSYPVRHWSADATAILDT